jgi:hypothetical protein
MYPTPERIAAAIQATMRGATPKELIGR